MKKYKILASLNLLTIIIILFIPFILYANRFTLDSWIYFRLSNKLFEGNYSHDINALDFPFGFPFIIALVNKIFGRNYLHAIYINLIVTLLNIYLIHKIIKTYINEKFTNKHFIISILIGASLILNPFYLEEVYSGRAIPFSLLLILIGYYFILIRNTSLLFIASILFGAAATIRFDLVIGSYSILIIILLFHRVNENEIRKKLILITIGYLIGIAPWVIFSELNYGHLYESTNSIMTLSSIKLQKGHYNDLSIMKVNTIFNNPVEWLFKVLSYFPSFLFSFFIAALCQPFFLLMSFIAVLNKRKKFILCLIMLSILIPHLVAGFTDQRYFTIYFIICSLLLVKINEKSLYIIDSKIFVLENKYIIYLIGVAIFFAYISKYIIPNTKSDKVYEMIANIEIIKACHILEKDYKYIFHPDSNIKDDVYSGITGMNVVFPVGFKTWDEWEKNNFFDTLGNYRLINFVDDDYKCN